MQIGERLFNMRQKSNLSLQDVATAVGISKAHVWELEKGRSKNPSFDLVQKLARHYGVSIDALIGDDDEPDTTTLQIERLHRGFEGLSDGDRTVVEQMIKSLKIRAEQNG